MQLLNNLLIYNNIKSHKKTGLHPVSEDTFVEKPQGRGSN